ncbi:multidrug and toxin extrusion protein 1-like [Liolophura sinensis]|uniref:multidrug and toxin extrusion protein 1-like n=1 Tax=Liolophura sinensis TaxID=3198878 RepID=UPI0031586B6E
MGEEALHRDASSLANIDISVENSDYGTVTNDNASETMAQPLWKRLFPNGFKSELKQIFALSWPVYLTALFNFILGPISLIFCGHLGRYELDGAALAISLLNITGLSICTGLCTACDTLFAQNKVYPPVVIGGLGNILNALGQYIAVYVLGYGIRNTYTSLSLSLHRGSAVAQALAFAAMSFATLFYIIFSGTYKKTWPGWSWKALEHWGLFLRLAIPGLVMMGIEMWSFEIGIFLNGLLGEVELGATSVTFQIEAILYMIPLGISLSCSIRVGQNLGAGNANAAKTSARVAQAFALVVFVVSAVLLLSLKNVLPVVFTEDPDIIDLVSRTIPLIVFIQFLDAITATTMGTLRGCGHQLAGAIFNFIGYVVLTVPLAVVLMFVVKVGALGFWLGLCMGITVVSVVYIIWMFRINWEAEVSKARKRASEFKRKRNNTENTPLISERQDIISTTEETEALVRSTLYLSSSLEMSMTESVDTSLTSHHKALLTLKRILAVLITLAVLVGCLLIRLYVPLPRQDQLWNSTLLTVVVSTGT